MIETSAIIFVDKSMKHVPRCCQGTVCGGHYGVGTRCSISCILFWLFNVLLRDDRALKRLYRLLDGTSHAFGFSATWENVYPVSLFIQGQGHVPCEREVIQKCGMLCLFSLNVFANCVQTAELTRFWQICDIFAEFLDIMLLRGSRRIILFRGFFQY